MTADGGANLDARPRTRARERQSDSAEDGPEVALLDPHVRPLAAAWRDGIRPRRVLVARVRVHAHAAVRVVRAVVVVRVGRVDDHVEIRLVRDLRVLQRRQRAGRIVGCLGVAGVLPRHIRDRVGRGLSGRGVRGDARPPAVRVLDAGRVRSGVCAVLELAVVREPVADVDHERGHQEEDRDHHRAQHEDAASLFTPQPVHVHALPL